MELAHIFLKWPISQDHLRLFIIQVCLFIIPRRSKISINWSMFWVVILFIRRTGAYMTEQTVWCNHHYRGLKYWSHWSLRKLGAHMSYIVCVNELTYPIGSVDVCTWTNDDILSIQPIGANFSKILMKNITVFFPENTFENFAWKMAVILLRSQRVESM